MFLMLDRVIGIDDGSEGIDEASSGISVEEWLQRNSNPEWTEGMAQELLLLKESAEMRARAMVLDYLRREFNLDDISDDAVLDIFEIRGWEPEMISFATLLRHGKTEYLELKPDVSDPGLDLTEEGIEDITEAGQSLALWVRIMGTKIRVVCSPAARTRGTAKVLSDAAEAVKPGIVENNGNPLVVQQIRPTTAANGNEPRFRAEYEALAAEGAEQGLDPSLYVASLIADDTRENMFDDERIVSQGRRKVSLRARAAFHVLVADAIDTGTDDPHTAESPFGIRKAVVAAGHMETITPVLEELLGRNLGYGETIQKGEPAEVFVHEPLALEHRGVQGHLRDLTLVPLTIQYRGMAVTALYDMRGRKIVDVVASEELGLLRDVGSSLTPEREEGPAIGMAA